MSNLREIRSAMPAEFVEGFRNLASSYGMTDRQLAAVCIAIGFKWFSQMPESFELASEPSPFSADEIAEKTAVSRVAAGDRAQRGLPLTLGAVFGAISRK